LTPRNQTRYQRAEREAVITAIQNPAAFDAVTQSDAFARQPAREQIIRTRRPGVSRFSTGSVSHASTFGLDINWKSRTLR
jgi:hypothetical protein